VPGLVTRAVSAAAWAASPAALLAGLEVDPASGLAEEEAAARLVRFGPNRLPRARSRPAWRILLHQFLSPVVFLLLGAALLAALFGEWVEGGAILAVLALNTLIGFVTEHRAVRSMEALHSLGSRTARVLRGGRDRIVDAAGLVPGDIVLLEAGDAVPADLRILSASGLAADESSFTGESVPVAKAAEAVAAEARLAERRSMLFLGTSAVRGSAKGLVVATGPASELGHISVLAAGADSDKTPLEQGLSQLAGQMVWLTLLLAAAIAAIGLARGQDPLLIATTAIALAVAAIPEGLPIVATLALARGVWRMAGKQALVERLSAVETLGATTLILTDKTGTLTENRMHLARLALPSGLVEFGRVEPARLAGDAQLAALVEAGMLCNLAALGAGGEASGDPMEVALLDAAIQAGLDRAGTLARKPQVALHAFDAERRMMASVHREGGQYLYAVKGAPEAVLAHCLCETDGAGPVPLGPARREFWRERIALLGRDGLRVLALASKRAPDQDLYPYGSLTLLGLAGFEDPARADVPAAIRTCHEAGVKVVMVTGDHAATAHSIGRKVGIHAGETLALEGREFERLEGDGALLADTRIYARVNPEEKLALVRAYQRAGEVVAMTGDGVNDAPALRQADIGVAMGLRGTDVAREAADMVLLDDAFATIPVAIREGRAIFGNIRRFAAYLLACNLSEVLVVGVAILLGLPLPLLPLQILYLNLVTDVFPAFALAMGEADEGVMKHPPRPPGEAILARAQWRRLVVHGLVLSLATFLAMGLAVHAGLAGDALLTVTFLTIALSQLWHVFAMRHPASHPLRNEVVRNPWVWRALALCLLLLLLPAYLPALAAVFHLVPPDARMWAIVLGASLLPLLLIQSAMVLFARRAEGGAA